MPSLHAWRFDVNENDRRNIADFYAHRMLVLTRIQASLVARRLVKRGGRA